MVDRTRFELVTTSLVQALRNQVRMFDFHSKSDESKTEQNWIKMCIFVPGTRAFSISLFRNRAFEGQESLLEHRRDSNTV